MKILTIDIGGTFIKYSCMTDSMEILLKNKVPTPTENREQDTTQVFLLKRANQCLWRELFLSIAFVSFLLCFLLEQTGTHILCIYIFVLLL